MENNQKQNHTENGADVTKKQNAVSPMFWEDFDKAESEAVLEKTQTKIEPVTQEQQTDNDEKEQQKQKEEAQQIIEETSAVEETAKIDDVIASVNTTSDIETTAKIDDVISSVNETTDNDDIDKQDDDVATEIIEEESETAVEEDIEQTKVIEAVKQETQETNLEETQRFDVVQEQKNKSAFSEILQKVEKKNDVDDDLGDKNAYLDNFESEHFEEDELFPTGQTEEETIEEDIYYDEETSIALYQAERRRMKLLLLCCVVIGIVVFLIGYMIMGMHQKELREMQRKLAAEQATTVIDNRHVMVRTVATNRELSVHDINTDEEYIIKTNSDTKFINHSGKQSSVTKIQRGDLLSVIMEEDGQTAKQIQYSASTWMAREVNGLSVDTEQKTVSITFVNGTEPKTYRYAEDNLFLYKDGEIPPESIDPCDVITMQGKGDRVWSIKVVESHGMMTVKHQEDIVNGVLTIDDKEKYNLKDFTELAVTEGVHKISVTGDNIESFEDTIFVVPREDFVYDLSKAQSKTGVVIINANVYDFKLYINGADADGTKPIVLPVGEYDIVVLKNGYKKWNQKITVEEPSVTVDVWMEEDIQEGIISFHSVPEGALIVWNDKEVGVTPFDQKVRYGVYTVEVVLEGYQPHFETVVVDKSAVNVTSYLTAQQEDTAETDQLQ